MELLSFTFAANETKRFERAGRYIEVIDAPYAFNLFLSDAAGGRVDHALNALSGLFLEGNYAAVDMTNGANAQTVTLLVTDGRGGSRRQPGVVQVVDGGRARTLANVAGVGSVPASAVIGNFSHVQLWNPAGSGRNVFVRNVVVATATVNGFYIRTHNAALTTLIGNPVSKLNQNILTSYELRSQSNAALLGQGVLFSATPANTPFPYRFEEPMCLAPGIGLMASGGSNSDIQATFDFFHEAV